MNEALRTSDGLKDNNNSGDWDGWGDYMSVKRQKLSNQFEPTNNSNIFNGVSIYVNGYTSPSADVLRRLIIQNGGHYHTYCSNSRTTHTVATNLPRSKIVQLKPSDKVVRPEWITDSLKEGRLLPDKDYFLYQNVVNTVDQYLPEKQSDKPDAEKSKRDKDKNVVRFSAANDAKNPNFINNYYARSRLHMISTWCQEMKEFVKTLQQTNDGRFEGRQKLVDYLSTKSGTSDEKVEKSVFGDKKRFYAHLDMDCFFVSVGLCERPTLRGLPVVVTHSKGKGPATSGEFTSHAEIASCSYEARERGVKNGMWLGDALKLCPDIKTIPYDFEKYKAVSKQFYVIVASFTLNIKAVSCDEMFVDLAEVCHDTGSTPLDVASIMRQEIFEKTGCPASCGIGPNILVARLATRKAKPNGQLCVAEENVEEFMKTQKISDLPGVGRSTTEKLDKLKIFTCADLVAVPLKVLQKEFGPKNGQHLYDFARGIDDRKICEESEHVARKSISCDVNYGIRFTEFDEVAKFLDDLSKEVCRRLKSAKMKGRTICLKCLTRCNTAPVATPKFLGHGMVDSISKSFTLHQPTGDCQVVYKETLLLFKQMNLHIPDLRGIGISLHKLESDDLKHASGLTDIMKYVQKKAPAESPGAEDNACIFENDSSETTDLNLNSSNGLNASIELFVPSQVDESVLSHLPDSYQRKIKQTLKKISETADLSSEEEPDFCGSTSYEDVKEALKNWVESVEKPLSDDCSLVSDYMIRLIDCCQMEKAYRLLQSFVRCIEYARSEDWASVYIKIVNPVQKVVIKKYGLPLNLPDSIVNE